MSNDYDAIRKALEDALREAEARADNPRYIEYYTKRWGQHELD